MSELPRPPARQHHRSMGVVMAHYWVDDRLYEADYYKAIRHDGRSQFVKVDKSERECRCPGHEVLERQRQGAREVCPSPST